MSYLIEDIVVTAATEALVEVYEFKEFARINYDSEDALIENLLKAAEQHVEAMVGRGLQTQTRRAHYSTWPSVIVLPSPQVASVTSVVYLDDDRTETTLAASEYIASALALPWAQAEIVPVSSWPSSLSDDDADPVRVTYVCGYGAASDVPEPLRHAVRMLVAHWYEHREEVFTGSISKQIEMGFRALVEPYRFRRVFD